MNFWQNPLGSIRLGLQLFYLNILLFFGITPTEFDEEQNTPIKKTCGPDCKCTCGKD